MVTRQQNALKSAMIIDLDGTYIQGNTLHIYLRCAIHYHFRHFRPLRALRIMALLAQRRLHLITHVDMKFRALELAGRDHMLLSYFGMKAAALVHPRVEQLRHEYAELGGQVLLATAAADFYIPHLWTGDYVATRMDRNPNRRECRGNEKLRRVQEWLDEHHARMAVVITDHQDDLPLLRANDRGINYLVRDEEVVPFRTEEQFGASTEK
jgi:phosphoserine phosphatase